MNDILTNAAPEVSPCDLSFEAKKAARWWRGLQRTLRNGETNPNADPGALARLRRASAPIEALTEPVVHRLYRELSAGTYNERRAEAVAVLAMVLAHVRKDCDDDREGAALLKLGHKLAAGDPPLLSTLRLKRLTSAREGDDVLRCFREAVALLRDTVPVVDLVCNVLGWMDEDCRDQIRTRFLFDYHGAQFTPSDTPSDAA